MSAESHGEGLGVPNATDGGQGAAQGLSEPTGGMVGIVGDALATVRRAGARVWLDGIRVRVALPESTALAEALTVPLDVLKANRDALALILAHEQWERESTDLRARWATLQRATADRWDAAFRVELARLQAVNAAFTTRQVDAVRAALEQYESEG